MKSSSLLENSTRTIVQAWFIPIDILLIVCTCFTISLAILFLLIIILDKTCHTLPMMLTANSCFSIFVYASVLFSSSIFTLYNDFQQNEYQDFFCALRGYLVYPACAMLDYSFMLQAAYRYIMVVYPKCVLWRSIRVHLLLITISWVFSFAHTIIFLLHNQVVYNVDNQICQIPLGLSVYLIYGSLSIYMIPILMIMLIYFKLTRYVYQMSQFVTPMKTLSRARRQLKVVQQTVTIITILLTLGFPYELFLFMSFFGTPPKYHFRIAFIFVDGSMALVMIVIFQYADPLKIFVKKRLHTRVDRRTTSRT